MSTPPPPTNIPKPIFDIYEGLRHEITWLHGRWITFNELFGKDSRRIDMLNECAGTFFFIIQRVLFDEVQVCLSKLTDPAVTMKKFPNLSLEQLQDQIEKHGDAGLAVSRRAVLDKIMTGCEPFRKRRDKELAHFDLQTAIDPHATPLPDVSRQMVEEVLEMIRDYMNAIPIHYDDNEWGYENFFLMEGAPALVSTLKAGLRYRELQQSETIDFDDWTRAKWRDA